MVPSEVNKMVSLDYSNRHNFKKKIDPFYIVAKCYHNLEHGLQRISNSLWLSLLILLIFDALANPYAGVVHDARLYALQALSHIHPGRYGRDLFLLFGSQDSYTIFSPIYVQFIKIFGLMNGSLVLYLLSKFFFFLSLILFFRQFCKNKLVAFLAAIIISCHEIHYIFFDINEAFLTPRLASIGFSLLALKAVLQGHFLLPVLFLLFSALFHPIMAAGAGITVCVTWILRNEWRYVFLSAGILLCCCFMINILHTSFFNNLSILQQFDPEWRSIVAERASYLFPGEWPTDEWILIFISTAVAVFSYFFISNDQKNIIAATVITVGGCLFLTSLFTYIFPLSLPIQIQPWRAFWILRILNPLLCIETGYRLWRKNTFWYQLAAVMMTIIAFMGGGIGSDDYIWIFPVIVLCLLPLKWADQLNKKTMNLILAGLLAILLFIPLSAVLINYNNFSGQLQWNTGIPVLVLISDHFFPIIISLFFFYLYTYVSIPIASLAAACFFIILCIPGVNPNMKYFSPMESNQSLYKYNLLNMCKADNPNLKIPPGSMIIADESVPVSKIWFELRSACYWSRVQGAGVVFNRKLAFEYEKRRLKQKDMNIINPCDRKNLFNFTKDQTTYVVSNKKFKN